MTRARWPAPVRRWLRCLTVAMVLGVLAILPTAAAQGAPIAVYRSPEFGYLFWWDEREWTVQGQEATPGSDRVQLANADTLVDIWAYAAPGIGADACLQDRLDRLRTDPALVRFESLAEPGAAVALNEWSDADRASVSMVLGFATDNGRVTVVAQEECIAVPAGGFMLFTALWRDAAAYNGDNALDGGPLHTVTMPRSVWTFMPGEFVPQGPLLLAPEQVFDVDGSEAGILTTHTFYDCDTEDGTIVVVAEGTDISNFVVDPDAFAVTNDGRVLSPTSVRWIEPPIPPDNAAALGAGQTALLELAYADGGQITYRDPLGNPIVIGGLGGCGGGGGAPVLIDLE
jgi:hypothetical protein